MLCGNADRNGIRGGLRRLLLNDRLDVGAAHRGQLNRVSHVGPRSVGLAPGQRLTNRSDHWYIVPIRLEQSVAAFKPDGTLYVKWTGGSH